MSLSHVWPKTATIAPNGHLLIAGHDVTELAAQYDTPLYVFDELTIREMCQAYLQACIACGAADAVVHYAGKALLNTAPKKQ